MCMGKCGLKLTVQVTNLWVLHMQETLFVLVVDNSEEVSAAAQELLEYSFASRKDQLERDVAEIFCRFVRLLLLDSMLVLLRPTRLSFQKGTCMLQPNNLFISRLIDTLPKVVFGSEEFLAITQARQLLVIIHYSGPQFVVDHLLHSPVCFSFS